MAARRQRAARRDVERGYPPVGNSDDPTGDTVALAATRALLKADSREQAARVLRTALTDMGATVVPARLAAASAASVDVSLGVGEPLVVEVPDPTDLAALRLAHHLPMLVEDALAAAARCDHHLRQSLRAATDPLTGVASRATIGTRLGLAEPGDMVCLVDLDGLGELNDTRGHDVGDQVLRGLGQLLDEATGDAEFVGRYGGDEFLLLLTDTPSAVGFERARHLAASWILGISHRTSLSIGLAVVGDEGAAAALTAAEQALRRAKRLGGDRVELATRDDYLRAGPASP
jgi:diguanylate cyclase (GGDEF)-like protein